LLRLGTTELVLRRPPFGNEVKSAHDMGREFRVLQRLSPIYPPAPHPYLYCEDPQVIGAPFYVMERRHGIVLRKHLPGQFSDAQLVRRLSHALVDNLAVLHGLDLQHTGLAELGKPEGYAQRQVLGWNKRYEQARTADVPAMEQAAEWLAAHRPLESRAALIHNDYKFDNLLLAADEPTRIVAVLDWEMATVGDPLMDLGATLGYWVEAGDPEPLRKHAFGPTAAPGNLSRRELVDRYRQQTSQDVSDPVFYYVFGLFKIAVIVQQIFARYARGHTRDPRFAQLDGLVLALSGQAQRAIEHDEW
jgi:aminoglycoside phosphotransferase (APT) family kinase protein